MVWVKKIFSALWNSFLAILRGEFLLRLGFDRYFAHVLYVFLLVGASIWASLLIEKSLNQVERGKEVIYKMSVIHTMDQYELEKVNSREAVKANLEKMGSELVEADEPAYTLE